jgi:opacity protein-like surface antigen
MQKKLILIFATIGLFMTQVAHAQSFEKGKTYISLGYSLYDFGRGHRDEYIHDDDIKVSFTAIPIAFRVEYALRERGSFGISTYYENYDLKYSIPYASGIGSFEIQHRLKLFTFNVWGKHHLGKLQSRFDPYLGLGLGFTRVFFDEGGFLGEKHKDKDYIFIPEIRLGGRYFLSEKMAAYFEVGVGTVMMHTGLTAKF